MPLVASARKSLMAESTVPWAISRAGLAFGLKCAESKRRLQTLNRTGRRRNHSYVTEPFVTQLTKTLHVTPRKLKGDPNRVSNPPSSSITANPALVRTNSVGLEQTGAYVDGRDRVSRS